jgi:ankyrin repeat protein
MLRDIDRDLIAATWRNDIAEATRLINAGADVNAKDDTIQSAFLITTSEGYHDLLMLTLAHGAEIDAKDWYNGTGLIRAADRGHARIIGTLLQAGIVVDHINNLGWTALHEAIILGDGSPRYVDCVRLILAGGADPALPSQTDGVSPLEHATWQGLTTIAQTLRTVLTAAVPDRPQDALIAAIARGDADAAVVAIRAGADPAVGHPTPGSDDANAALRLIRYLSPRD